MSRIGIELTAINKQLSTGETMLYYREYHSHYKGFVGYGCSIPSEIDLVLAN